MRYFDALRGYPEPTNPRIVGENIRTMHHRIIAFERDKEFFDGARETGYGGFNYDGRWLEIAKNMCEDYQLTSESSVLQINCEKGFLLNDFLQIHAEMEVCGTETSQYAMQNAMASVQEKINLASPLKLHFPDNTFDFVIGLGVVYAFTIPDAITSLKEIQRVTKGNSFITLASYQTEEEFWLFKHWTLLGNLLLKKNEWLEIMQYAGYTGDYKLTGAKSLNLQKG
jgi:hypothetical protein